VWRKALVVWLLLLVVAVLNADYDVFAGRIWVLVPIVTLFAPLVAARLRRRRADASVPP
jgi:hypothetical protein